MMLSIFSNAFDIHLYMLFEEVSLLLLCPFFNRGLFFLSSLFVFLFVCFVLHFARQTQVLASFKTFYLKALEENC